jgi:hypothetical protein
MLRTFRFIPELLPAYWFKRWPLAWRCSTCHRLFCLSLEEAQNTDTPLPPGHIAWEFSLHNCELHLSADFGARFPDPDL